MMKAIMATHSVVDADGIPYLEYHIEKENYASAVPTQLSLFEIEEIKPAGRMKYLKEEILQHFKGKSVTVKDMVEEHHINKPYLSRNYKEALKQLERETKVTINPPARERRVVKGVLTLADACTVTFPN
jgi:hypothetical protein